MQKKDLLYINIIKNYTDSFLLKTKDNEVDI